MTGSIAAGPSNVKVVYYAEFCVTGIDTSPEMFDQRHSRIGQRHLQASLVETDMLHSEWRQFHLIEWGGIATDFYFQEDG